MTSRTHAINSETLSECSIEICEGGLLAGMALIATIDIPRVDEWMILSLIRVIILAGALTGHWCNLKPRQSLREGLLATESCLCVRLFGEEREGGAVWGVFGALHF